MGVPVTVSVSPSFVWSAARLARLPGWSAAVGGRARTFAGVTIDSRAADLRGSLFVALSGERHDGHRFAAAAVRAGATGVVASLRAHLDVPPGTAVFRVADTRAALADLARLRRAAYRGPVVALTGSAGKTSTKEFAATLLGGRAYVNPGNFNNDVGVPLSIFQAPLDAAAWIFELGMNHAGEIAALTAMVAPDLGVLLPPGQAHVGHLGGADAVLRAKAEMLSDARAPRTVIVCDDRYLPFVRGQRVLRVGSGSDCDVRIVAVRDDFPAGMTATLRDAHGTVTLRPRLIGKHWAAALAAAWTIGRELHLLDRRAVTRAAAIAAAPGRMALMAHRGGWILDDSYNASPESVHRLLDTIAPLCRRTRLRFLLGDMAELGDAAARLHDDVAARLRGMRLAGLVVVGPESARACARAGLKPQRAATAAAGIVAATARWREGTLLAVKGAHGIGLYDALQRWKEGACSTPC